MDFGRELLESLPSTPVARVLEDGDVLVRQHELGTDVFVVLDGTLDAVIERGDEKATVSQFVRGQLFGELTAMSGGPRTATVQANGPCSVAVVPREDFAAWLQKNPDRQQSVAERARDRVDRNRAAAMLSTVFGDDNPEILSMVLPMVEWRSLDPGEVLFRQGDESGAAYLILSGRVAVSSDRILGARSQVELGRNQIVGELGVLDRLPRSATVTALRRTALAELPAHAIDAIVEQHPRLGLHLFRQALGRALNPEPKNDAAQVVMVHTTSTGTDLEQLVESATQLLASFGTVAVVDAASVDRQLGRDDVANAPVGSVAASRVTEWLHDLETSNDLLLLIGDPSATEWTLRAAEMADRSLTISSAHPNPDERRAIEELIDAFGRRELPFWRLVVHPAVTENPANHARILSSAERVLHMRVGNAADWRRAMRLLSGNGIGLALGGGGARGFAHIGAFRALLEAGIEPDVISGASIGAVAAVPIALDWSVEKQREFVHEGFSDLLDWTVPIVSFIKGERITTAIDKYLGGYQCESLWRPYSCVVTNLTHSRVDVRNSGPVNTAVRTSVSIPGVLPPMSEGGEVFVDGGVLNNLPADVVAADPTVRTVFAIDVSPPLGPRAKSDLTPSVSGLAMLAAKARKQRVAHPGAASVVMQTMVAGSSRARHRLIHDGTIDHYLHLSVKGSSLLAFDNIDPVIEQGYQSAKTQIEEQGLA